MTVSSNHSVPETTTSIDTIALGNDFARTMDQFATSIEDALEEKVNYRPTA